MKKDLITYNDFSQLDLRIGEVIDAQPLENSRKLVKLRVNLGEDYGEVEILAGIASVMDSKEIVGKKYIFLANLEPKNMAGETSNGMMIAADDNGKPEIIEVDSSLANGSPLC